MLFFKDGKLVQRLVGALPKEEIEKNLLSIIKTN
jgi:thioredoxin-like negative regulator of GroEL